MKCPQYTSLLKLSLRVVYGRWRHKWLLFLLMTACTAAVLFPMAAFALFQSVSFQSAHETYGDYDFLITDLSQNEAKQIKEEQDLRKSALLYIENYCDPAYKFNASIVYGDEALFTGLLSYHLVDGRLPQSSNEILCDTAFVKAYPDAICEQRVKLGNTLYEIVGTFYLTDETNAGTIYQPAFFLPFSACSEDSFPITLIMEGGSESQEEICRYTKQLQAQYQLNDDQVSLNILALSAAFMTEDGGIAVPYNRILQITVGAFALLGLLMILFLLRLSVKPIEQDSTVYAAMGISFVSLWLGLMLLTACMLFCSLIVSAVTLFSLFVIYLLVNNLPVGVHIVNILPALWYALGFSIITMAASSFFFWLIPRHSIAAALKNVANVCIGKSRQQTYSCLNGTKLPWLALARQMRGVHPLMHRLSVTVLVIGFGMFSSGIYLTSFLHLSTPTVSYDYQITYQYLNWMNSLTGSENISTSYQRILQHESMDVYSYYVTAYPVQLHTNHISEEYRSYKSEQFTEYAEIFRSDVNQLYTDNFLIIGANAQDLQQLYGIASSGITSGTCIAVENTMPVRQQEIAVKLPLGTEIYAKCNYGMDTRCLTLTVVETAEHITYHDNTFANLPIILVNETDFHALIPFSYPQQLFVNTDDSALLQQITHEDPELRLVDLSEKQEEVQRIRWSVIFFGCQFFLMLVFVIAISCFLMLQHRMDCSKGQYAMLKVIGFQERTICFMSIYDLVCLWLQGIVFGSIFAVTGCFALWLVINQDNSIYLPFAFSMTEWVIPTIVLTLAVAAAAAPILLTVRKLPIPEALHLEQT